MQERRSSVAGTGSVRQTLQEGNTMRKKITVVGAGKVGATTAQRLAERNYADIILADVIESVAEGEALQVGQAYEHFPSRSASEAKRRALLRFAGNR